MALLFLVFDVLLVGGDPAMISGFLRGYRSIGYGSKELCMALRPRVPSIVGPAPRKAGVSDDGPISAPLQN